VELPMPLFTFACPDGAERLLPACIKQGDDAQHTVTTLLSWLDDRLCLRNSSAGSLSSSG
jgi:hypothetical protein